METIIRRTRHYSILHIQSQNALKIQCLTKYMHDKTFGHTDTDIPCEDVVVKATSGLKQFNLSSEQLPICVPPRMALPDLAAPSLSEHFFYLGMEQAEPFLSICKSRLETKIPAAPREWSRNPGWTRYKNGAQSIVDYPTGDFLVFDVEVLVKLGHHPIIATAVSSDAWFSWTSPSLFDTTQPETLISMGPSDCSRVIVGHNVGYDRARIEEEFASTPTKTAFIDTLSLHSAVSALSTQQRPDWQKRQRDEENWAQEVAQKQSEVDITNIDTVKTSKLKKKITDSKKKEVTEPIELRETEWLAKTSANSLQAVAKLHLNKSFDKSLRNVFVTGGKEEVKDQFQKLMHYCANDVITTFEVFQVKCPHPLTFAGMLKLSKCFLPVNKNWNEFIQKSNLKYAMEMNKVDQNLLKIADGICEKYANNDSWKKDQWLKNLDWTVSFPKLKKTVNENAKPSKTCTEQLLIKRARIKRKAAALLGKPQWYKEFWNPIAEKVIIKLGMRISPFLLQISYRGNPILHHRNYGWFYSVPKNAMTEELVPTSDQIRDDFSDIDLVDGEKTINEEVFPAKEYPDSEELSNNSFKYCNSFLDENYRYYKIPHYAGPKHNCGNPLGKTYKKDFDSGVFSSGQPITNEVLDGNRRCGYWSSVKSRIEAQFVHRDSKTEIILPLMIPMGTVTRRAVEGTWMLLSNPKKDRIGSEVKSLVQAPPNHCFIGADVDSEELWIASLLGDAQFGIHGATPFGFMTLEGNKQNKTDLHSRTAQLLGVSRNDAKVFNYARIYGAGVGYAARILKLCSSVSDDKEIERIALNLYRETKGERKAKNFSKRDKSTSNRDGSKFWVGGSESFMFNTLEHIIDQDQPRTPALGCIIPDGLTKEAVDEKRSVFDSFSFIYTKFLTSRINWVVQSSGVDYLHLLLVSMDYLCRRMNIDAQFMISIHDEVRYMVREDQKYLATYALQISNLWTRCFFSSQSVSFFSSVDIDHCLRKEVTMDCITPSNTRAVPHGVSQTIYETIEKVKPSEDMFGDELASILRIKSLHRECFKRQKVPPAQILRDFEFVNKQMKEKVQSV